MCVVRSHILIEQKIRFQNVSIDKPMVLIGDAVLGFEADFTCIGAPGEWVLCDRAFCLGRKFGFKTFP